MRFFLGLVPLIPAALWQAWRKEARPAAARSRGLQKDPARRSLSSDGSLGANHKPQRQSKTRPPGKLQPMSGASAGWARDRFVRGASRAEIRALRMHCVAQQAVESRRQAGHDGPRPRHLRPRPVPAASRWCFRKGGSQGLPTERGVPCTLSLLPLTLLMTRQSRAGCGVAHG